MSFIEAIDALSAAIERGEYNGYGPRRIPDAADALVDRLSEAFLGAVAEDHELLQLGGKMMPLVLNAHGERYASLAVREQSSARLEESLRSLALSMLIGEARDTTLILVLPWRTAELLGVDPGLVFEKAAAALPDPARRGLLSFSQRSQEDRPLECMGYREAEDDDGFRYERTW